MNHNDEIYSLLQDIELLEVKLAAAKKRLTSRSGGMSSHSGRMPSRTYRTFQTFVPRNLPIILFSLIGLVLLAMIIVLDLPSLGLSSDAYFLLHAVAGVMVISFVVLVVWQIEETNRDRQLNILRDLNSKKREIARFRVEQGLDELVIARRSLDRLLQK